MQVLIELDDETLKRLEAVAPARSRKRSAFIRAAIQKSLWEMEEARTRRAYLAAPDGDPTPLDAAVWETAPFGGFDPPELHPAKTVRGAKAKTPAARRRSARRR